MAEDSSLISLAKAIANSGYCSRKQAEKLIKNQQVRVDDKIITNAALPVNKNNDVYINNQAIKINSTLVRKIYLFHKTAGCLTTHHDPQNRKTIFDFMPRDMHKLMTIGRLDYNTEGLILLTNDGNFARYMELPANKISRTYIVEVFGKLSEKIFHIPQNGLKIDKIIYRPQKIALIHQKNLNAKLKIVLTEGKNREIRNIMKFFNLKIKRLTRITFGDYKLDTLPRNNFLFLNT